MKWLPAFAALCGLFGAPAFSAVAVNGGVISGAITSSGTTQTYPSVTLAAGTNCLVVLESSGVYSGTAVAPSGITYNGIALTMVPASSIVKTVSESSIWYLVSPPAGTAYALVITYPSSIDAGTQGIIALSGVNTGSPLGTAATASGTGTAVAVTATGGASSDLYLAVGAAGEEGGTSTSGGSQTNLYAQTSRGGWTGSGDSIPGGGSGAFTWTESVSQDAWTASAVAFKASGSASAPIQGGFALSPSN